jgi:Ca2+-transporting ATPase
MMGGISSLFGKRKANKSTSASAAEGVKGAMPIAEEELICTMSPEQAIKKLRSSEAGLSEEQARSRQKVYGANRIERKRKSSPIKLFFGQFKDVMTLLLIAAAVISAVVAFVGGNSSDLCDTVIIIAIILLNAIVGTVQEYRADRAIEGLQKLSSSYAKVRRDGVERQVESESLTVGDIICLDEGDMVCADCRIISCNNLVCDESALTGESVGVEKFSKAVDNFNFLSSTVMG